MMSLHEKIHIIRGDPGVRQACSFHPMVSCPAVSTHDPRRQSGLLEYATPRPPWREAGCGSLCQKCQRESSRTGQALRGCGEAEGGAQRARRVQATRNQVLFWVEKK